eukprot:1687764-Rhodomonas_salina.1
MTPTAPHRSPPQPLPCCAVRCALLRREGRWTEGKGGADIGGGGQHGAAGRAARGVEHGM